MCFYDEYEMACGDHKWGHFRQHCGREYRTGETCGMKLIMETFKKPEKCKTCRKIDVKRARVDKELQRIEQWMQMGFYPASISTSQMVIEAPDYEITALENDRKRSNRLDGYSPTIGNKTDKTKSAAPLHLHSLQPPLERADQLLIPDTLTSTQTSANLVKSRGDDQPPKVLYQDNESDSIQERHSSPNIDSNKFPSQRRCEGGQDSLTQDLPDSQQTQGSQLQAQENISNPINIDDKQCGSEWDPPGETESANDTANDYDHDSVSAISEASSENSVAESLFSLFTASSSSSVGPIPHINERLYALLTVDDFKNLYAAVYNTSTARKSEQNLRRLLKVFALCLREEARSLSGKRAANFVLYRARNMAYLIIAQLIENKDKRSKFLDVQHPEERDISENEEQNDDDEEGDDVDGPDEDPTDISSLETFILRSNAIKDFRTHLEFLVQGQSGGKQITLSEPSSGDLVVMADPDVPQSLEKQWERTKEISWRCCCGMSFQEQITEFKPGAADALALSLSPSTSSSIDVEKLAGSLDSSSSGSSSCEEASGPNDTHRRSSAGKLSAETSGCTKDLDIKILEDIDDKQYILLCRKYRTDTKLHHADISKAPCDHSSYTVLHKQYYGHFPKLWRLLSFSEISNVEFVRFHLYWSTNVSIDVTDFGVLPPALSSEYSYNAHTSPPVPRTALRHFIEHPDHAPKLARHRHRIPKKVREQLSLHKDADSREGYGLYIQVRLNWMKIFVVEAVVATGCVFFAVGWCVGNQGGIQDGFAIAGTGIAYATIMLGTLQAVSQSWY